MKITKDNAFEHKLSIATKEINSVKDVEKFITQMWANFLNMDISASFSEVCNDETGKKAFTKIEAKRLDKLLDKAKSICNPNGENDEKIHQIAKTISDKFFRKAMNNQYAFWFSVHKSK